jgi:hypothetical protein
VLPKDLVDGQQNLNNLLVDVESDPAEEGVPPHIVTADMKVLWYAIMCGKSAYIRFLH